MVPSAFVFLAAAFVSPLPGCAPRACAQVRVLHPARPLPNRGAGPQASLKDDSSSLKDDSKAEQPFYTASRARFLASAGLIGGLTGLAIAVFKTSIAATASAFYALPESLELDQLGGAAALVPALIPAVGGVGVALCRAAAPRGRLGPGLAEHVEEVEQLVPVRPLASLARGTASVASLGTGNSMGPEGPSVELGMTIARLVGGFGTGSYVVDRAPDATPGPWPLGGYTIRACDVTGGDRAVQKAQREYLAAGAAAGVAAGFNAPLAGVFFSLEVVAKAVRASVVADGGEGGEGGEGGREGRARARDSAELDVKTEEAIFGSVVAALIAAAVVQQALGDDLALRPGVYNVRSPLVELPLYVGLGALSGGVALLFRGASDAARSLFRAPVLPPAAGGGWRPLPDPLRPVLGGLACGALGLAFPQVLFFGYSTLDAILASGAAPSAAAEANVLAALAAPLASVRPTELGPALSQAGYDGGAPRALAAAGSIVGIVELLGAKLVATSICVGSGLVGGTFAPSLFLGAVLGIAYQAIAGDALAAVADAIAAYQTSIGVPVGSWGVIPQLTVADAPAYAMIGAAATLASVFRAPLTASLLLFELTRGYDIVLPLLAATGTGPLVVQLWEQSRLAPPRPSRRAVRGSRGDEGCEVDPPGDGEGGGGGGGDGVGAGVLGDAGAAEGGAACVDDGAAVLDLVAAECDVDNRIVCDE